MVALPLLLLGTILVSGTKSIAQTGSAETESPGATPRETPDPVEMEWKKWDQATIQPRYYLTESPCNHRGFLFLQSPPKHQKHTSHFNTWHHHHPPPQISSRFFCKYKPQIISRAAKPATCILEL
jgi:hypothetical protein